MTSKATILVVEDDEAVRGLVRRCLESESFEVFTVATGADALSLAERLEIDLAVIDLRLPDLDGMVLVRQFSDSLGIPVLVLSGLGEPARVTAALRARRLATRRQLTTSGMLRFDDWTLDLRRQTMIDGDGQTIALSNAEFKLLKALLDHPNRVLSREQILSLTHSDEVATERSVDIQVTRLRKKMERDSASPRFIRTVRRLGYMLVADRIEFA